MTSVFAQMFFARSLQVVVVASEELLDVAGRACYFSVCDGGDARDISG